MLLLQRHNQCYGREKQHVYNAVIGAAFIVVCMNPGADEEWVVKKYSDMLFSCLTYGHFLYQDEITCFSHLKIHFNNKN